LDFTDEQRRAVSITDQNLQIIACAGSGKTRVVAGRVINILRQHGPDGITPDNIVAFTFTEKAAAELKDRITRFYLAEFGNIEGLAGMYVGTIHGFCLEILQRYLAQYLKYDVLDEVRQRLFVDRYYQQCGMGSLGLKRWVESNQYITALRVLREADVDARALRDHPIRAAYTKYVELLDKHRYVDYDEIVVRALGELISNPRLRDQICQRVKFLVVDEYQDVSPVQELLVRTIHDLGANLCVVGDDDQNIYQWRGSDVRHIVSFTERYPGVTQVPLVTNFRSSTAIVTAARRVVEVNLERITKEMKSGGKRSFERGDLLALKFDTPEVEAEWIAGKILAMRGVPWVDDDKERGLSWSDCAILLRSVRNNAGPLVAALRAREIPYIVTGMTGLFDTPEVQAAVGIFQYVTREITEEDLKQLWLNAQLGLTPEQLERGVALLADRRSFDTGKRFSVYNLQRAYLDFLEAIMLREEQVPGGRGELVYYNLGKFSQVISDFEEIHFHSGPQQKYEGFVGFLRYQAPGYYPEGGQDVAYTTPDAVKIMTVHQAKGMEYPVVFLPALQANRFPAKRQANRVWQILPRQAVRNADRYDGTNEDERRLFYVALTRSEKYLFASWAPIATNQLYRKPSMFWTELTQRDEVLTTEPAGARTGRHVEPGSRRPMVNVELSFSDLKYFFACPYQFKLRFLYGFNPPLHEALGYGRSLHNSLAEIHRRALAGETLKASDVPGLVEEHLYVRYAYPELEETLRKAAKRSLDRYLREYGPYLDKLEHAEETVQVNLDDGIVVDGRIDLIRRTDTDETVIVDFKSTERAQEEDITRLQLHVYALGYQERFGKKADLVEIHNMDEGGSQREMVDDAMTTKTVRRVVEAGHQLRENRLDRLINIEKVCHECDLVGICRTKPAAGLAT
jgi:DNA helicase-2/ATP-dependent DNA helicase PcrA